MPAYKVNWSDYQKYKAQGGTFKDYTGKEPLPYDITAIKNHLIGKETCGIYPLLDDNTSYFIAADFDKENWFEIILRLHRKCSEYKIPSYIERSRSGKGGHLWIFFESAFPAEQSRKIMFELLRHSGIISQFQKEPGFDRLFPNQDFHSGKAMGNLIALPLNGISIQSGNSCFINPETFEPYPDQWEFLKSVRKVSIDKFRDIYQELFDEIPQERIISLTDPGKPYELEIIIKNQIFLRRGQLGKRLIVFLREHLNFLNSNYLIKKKSGKSVIRSSK